MRILPMLFSPKDSNVTDRRNSSSGQRRNVTDDHEPIQVEDVQPQDELDGEEEVTFHVQEEDNDLGLSYDQLGQEQWDHEEHVQGEWNQEPSPTTWEATADNYTQEDQFNQPDPFQQQQYNQDQDHQQFDSQNPTEEGMINNIVGRLTEHMNRQLNGYFKQFDSVIDLQKEIDYKKRTLQHLDNMERRRTVKNADQRESTNQSFKGTYAQIPPRTAGANQEQHGDSKKESTQKTAAAGQAPQSTRAQNQAPNSTSARGHSNGKPAASRVNQQAGSSTQGTTQSKAFSFTPNKGTTSGGYISSGGKMGTSNKGTYANLNERNDSQRYSHAYS